MTKDEVLDLLDDLVAVYGRKMNMENGDNIIKVWYWGLAECDPERVQKNFIAYIQHSPFPPTPADMAKNAVKKKQPKQFVMDYTAGEDWDV